MNVRLWTFLSQIVFRHELQTIQSFTILRTTMTALKLSSLVPKGVVDRVHFTSSAMVSLCHVMNDDSKTAITSALNGIRKFPKVHIFTLLNLCACIFNLYLCVLILKYFVYLLVCRKEKIGSSLHAHFGTSTLKLETLNHIKLWSIFWKRN